MTQAAADYDYLVDWMKSPSFNNGVHLPPHPAGKNTKDEYLLAHSSERVDGVSYDGYVIDDDHIIHYRYIYEGTAASLCSALYSYKTNRYLVFTNLKNLYAVVPHNFPLCIGCAVDANLQKIRICRMKIKKIEYVQKIRG